MAGWPACSLCGPAFVAAHHRCVRLPSLCCYCLTELAVSCAGVPITRTVSDIAPGEPKIVRCSLRLCTVDRV